MTNAPVREDDGPRINEDIRTKEVRLIDENGENCGIVPIREALSRAEDAGLDLIEISPQAVPPVCKILDYGKYKYEVQKRKNEAKKNQKVVEIKELKLRPMIDTMTTKSKSNRQRNSCHRATRSNSPCDSRAAR